MGGGVGEVHGAKLTGLLRRAAKHGRRRAAAARYRRRAPARSQCRADRHLRIMRATWRARCRRAGGRADRQRQRRFGGMGIVARCCTTVIMSEEGRLSLSGRK
jgi:malonate decarboxylase beta subunit